MKTLRETISSAWVGVVSHKLRSSLTILGMVIGVAAVIALMALGQGTQESILSQVENLGANRLTITAGAVTGVNRVQGAAGSASTLTLEDGQAIETSVKGVQYVIPTLSSQAQLVVTGANANAQVIGTGIHYKEARNLSVTAGNFFSQMDYDEAENVVVLGSDINKTLFAADNSIGQRVRIGGNIFRVVGVLESKGSGLGSSDGAVIIPLTVTRKLFTQPHTAQGGKIISSLDVTMFNTDETDRAKADITALLRQRHRLVDSMDNDFNIFSMKEIIDIIATLTNILTTMLTAIAAISLLVGGVGVMNIMLVSVMERTREIGIRKALGARERDIWIQFLYEAAFLSLAGGLIGVAFGWTLSFVVDLLVLNTVVTLSSVILAVSVSIGIGVFFGFYPAWSASRLNPIQALRAE